MRNTGSVGIYFGSRVDMIGRSISLVPSLPGLTKPNDLLATGHRKPL